MVALDQWGLMLGGGCKYTEGCFSPSKYRLKTSEKDRIGTAICAPCAETLIQKGAIKTAEGESILRSGESH